MRKITRRIQGGLREAFMKKYFSALFFLGFAFILLAIASGGGSERVQAVAEGEEKALIEAYDGKQAYEIFSRSIERLSPEEQHERAHLYGAALYAVEGVEGLSACDDRFSYGCFHEFLGRAIAAEGLGVVDELNERCFDALAASPLSCQHGIGHGVLAHLGYEGLSIRHALSICKGLPYADPIGGCYGGVFMEYNMRTMLGEDGGVRPVENANLHGPCDALSPPYKNPCYFWQAQWWRNILDPGRLVAIENVYAQMGGLCREAGLGVERACFEGIGNNAPSDADFDARTLRSLCDVAASNEQELLYCRSLGANSLAVGGAGKKGDAEAVCEGLPEKAHAYCLAYARNQHNVMEPGTFSL